MANWLRKLEIRKEFEAADRGEMAVCDLCKVVADRLEELQYFGNELWEFDLEKDDLIFEFNQLAMDKSADFDSFNFLFNELYDWADTSLDGKFGGKKICWID